MQNSALMSFLFRLFVRLQAIGTVPAIDMAAYATFLNNVVTEDL
jgi:hypothetical protein